MVLICQFYFIRLRKTGLLRVFPTILKKKSFQDVKSFLTPFSEIMLKKISEVKMKNETNSPFITYFFKATFVKYRVKSYRNQFHF